MQIDHARVDRSRVDISGTTYDCAVAVTATAMITALMQISGSASVVVSGTAGLLQEMDLVCSGVVGVVGTANIAMLQEIVAATNISVIGVAGLIESMNIACTALVTVTGTVVIVEYMAKVAGKYSVITRPGNYTIVSEF
jgi:hypothetical protein